MEDKQHTESKKTETASGQTSIRECVFVVKDGSVTLKSVKTGIQDNSHIQILEGLSPGEEVVTGPYNAVSRLLKTGDHVKVVSREELFAKKEK